VKIIHGVRNIRIITGKIDFLKVFPYPKGFEKYI
jgi:hypothetical protein